MLITTAEPTVGAAPLREPLDLEGHRRPRVLVIDTGLRTASNGNENHSRARLPALARPHRAVVSISTTSWQSNPDVEALDDEDEPRRRPFGSARLRGRTRHVHHRDRPPDLSRRHHLPGRGVVELRRRFAGPRAVDDLADEQFVRTLRHRRDELRDVLCRRRSRPARDLAASAARRRHRRGRGRQLQSCRPYFPAALPGVIGVGGLDRGGPAWFSNFGSWVDACAPAVNIVSTFFNDFTEASTGDRGGASVSGLGGAGPASPRRRSLGRSPRRCT